MNSYQCFYSGRSIDVEADTTYKAQQEAAQTMKVPAKKRYMISVLLTEKAGEPYYHSTTEL